jgi:hypothetical protein
MATVTESLASNSSLNASLVTGINTLSQNQQVTFTCYQRVILPLDGFIFWLRTTSEIVVTGSLHVSTQMQQKEDETIGINRAIFTCADKIQDFNFVAPDSMYIADMKDISFGFSSQGNFYEQAGIYHYVGEAINPAMRSQIVDFESELDLDRVIVSNSLPVWLALGVLTPVFGRPAPSFPIYPSFLIPQNALPPYAAVQIGESDTEAIQSAPRLDYAESHFQLAKDRVKITFYGLRNDDALDFQDYLFQYSLDTDIIGIMNMPVMRDEKRTQREQGIIAQKKSMVIDVSYYQSRVRELGRQFIKKSIQTYLPKLTP